MYKLVAIDLDGTLLNSLGEVSQNTRKALLKAKEKGVEIVLSSGRTIDSVKNLAIELGVDNYLISGNGAVVYDIKPIAVEDAKMILGENSNQFLTFINIDTGKVNVIYKLKDAKNFGLIEPEN